MACRRDSPQLASSQVERVVVVLYGLELAGTKVKAVLQRVEAKDDRDVAALLEHGVKLEILGSACALLSRTFNPLIAHAARAAAKRRYLDPGDVIATHGSNARRSGVCLRATIVQSADRRGTCALWRGNFCDAQATW